MRLQDTQLQPVWKHMQLVIGTVTIFVYLYHPCSSGRWSLESLECEIAYSHLALSIFHPHLAYAPETFPLFYLLAALVSSLGSGLKLGAKTGQDGSLEDSRLENGI